MAFPGHWIGRRGPFDGPVPSSDLTPCEFFLLRYLKEIVLKEGCTSIRQLQNRIQEVCAGITKAMCLLEKDEQFLSLYHEYI